MSPKSIKKFNDYCAEVMGYDVEAINFTNAYNPYYNLHELAPVVEELINLTGKYPEGDILLDRNTSTWQIWHSFVISTMSNEKNSEKPEGWDEYIKIHNKKLTAMENKEHFWEGDGAAGEMIDMWELDMQRREEAQDDEMLKEYVRENDESEAKLKAKLRLELATYEDNMVSMEDYIGQIITICNIHFIANSNILTCEKFDKMRWHNIEEEGLPPVAWRYYDVYTFHREDENFRIIKKMFDDGGGRWEDDDGPYPHPVTHWKYRRTPDGEEEGTILDDKL